MPIPEEWNLSGKIAIITADKRGWTPSLASALAEAGADVAIAGADGTDRDDAVKAVQAQGRKAIAIKADVTSEAEVNAMMQTAISEFGKLDILVNNTRVEFAKPFADVSLFEWQAVMDYNVKSMFLCCQAAGKHMLEQGSGRIINIGSGLAARGLWNSTAACAAQGAIHQLTSALALEWSRQGIRVNSIGAGWVTAEEQTEESQKELLVRYLPSRRKGHPNDLAGLLVYLASDACDFVTGQTIFVDGGALAHA